MEKRIPKSSKNPGVKQGCTSVFSCGRGGNGTEGRKGPAQDFTEICGLCRGKEKGETCLAVRIKRTGNERAVLGPLNGIFLASFNIRK